MMNPIIGIAAVATTCIAGAIIISHKLSKRGIFTIAVNPSYEIISVDGSLVFKDRDGNEPLRPVKEVWRVDSHEINMIRRQLAEDAKYGEHSFEHLGIDDSSGDPDSLVFDILKATCPCNFDICTTILGDGYDETICFYKFTDEEREF